MKRKYLLVAAMLSAVITLNAQSVENHLSKVDFLAPGYTYEGKLTSKTTFMANAAIGGFWGIGGGETVWGIAPHINLAYRYYNNLNRRTNLGKHISGNSGNYFAPKLSIVFPGITKYKSTYGDYGIVFSGVYGLQRTYKNGIYIMGEIGIGVYSTNLHFVPIGDFKVGYVFKHKKD